MINSGTKYRRKIIHEKDGCVDVYSVLAMFDVRCPARQHAIKKLLCAGMRNKGSAVDDLQEAHDAVSRAIEMERGKSQREVATQAGKKRGAPPKIQPDGIKRLKARKAAGATVRELQDQFNLSRASVYRILNQ